jgi:hypothetical protein
MGYVSAAWIVSSRGSRHLWEGKSPGNPLESTNARQCTVGLRCNMANAAVASKIIDAGSGTAVAAASGG